MVYHGIPEGIYVATDQNIEDYKKKLAESNLTISQQLKLLEEYKQQASIVASKKIPERKYGSGVTKETQQQYIKQRQEAQAYIERASQQEAELKATSSGISAAQADIKAREKAMKLYQNRIAPMYVKGTPVYKYLLELYKHGHYEREANEKYNYNKQLEEYKAQQANTYDKQYNDWAATQKSIAPHLAAKQNFITLLTTPPVKQIYKVDTTSFNNKFANQYTRSTVISQPYNQTYEIQTQPYLKNEALFTTEDVRGKPVTVYSNKIVYVDPTVIGKQAERPAVESEIKEFKAFEKENQVSNTLKNIEPSSTKEKVMSRLPSGTVSTYNILKSNLAQTVKETREYLPKLLPEQVKMTNEVGLKVLNTALPNEKIRDVTYIAVNNPLFTNKIRSGISRFVDKPLITAKEHPYKFAAEWYGASRIGKYTGIIFKGAPLAVGKVVKAQGYTKTGLVLEKGTRYGLTGLGAIGTGTYAYQSGKDLVKASALGNLPEEAADISTNLLAFSSGAKKAGRLFEKKSYIGQKVEINKAEDIIQPIITPESNIISLGKFERQTKVYDAVVYSDRPIKEKLRNFGIVNRYTGMTYEKTLPSYNINGLGKTISKEGNLVYGQTVSGREGKSLKYVDITEAKQKKFEVKRLLEANELTILSRCSG